MNSDVDLPLVITTAFSPKSDVPHLDMKKSDVRTRETLYSIMWWVCKSGFMDFVIVETTGDDTFRESLQTLAAASGKRLEYIAIENDHASVARYGKGFGEGHALDIAFDISDILADHEGFFKCTGKVIVENYPEFVQHARSKDFCFETPRGLKAFVDTRFYYVSKKIYKDVLRSSYKQVNDSQGFFLEHAYFRSLASVGTIPYNPVVIRYRGVSGTSGNSYETGFMDYLIRTCWRRSYAMFDSLHKRIW